SILIICVGNLNFGGSGKTPLTNYLIELLKTRYKIAVLSRGYGRKTKGFRIVQVNDNFIECGDEPLMYKLKHPDIIVAVCENRVEGVRQLLHLYPDLQIILLDDAFQHRKIKADFNILVSDFSLPFYKDQLFPLGSLRDLKSRVTAADMLIYTKTPDNTDNSIVQQVVHQTKTYFSKDIFFSGIEYAHVYSINTLQKINPYTELSKYNCILVTGIANPSPLAVFIKEYAQHFYHLSFPDHHAFTDKDWDLIKNIYTEWQKKYPPVIIITTEKDAMRLKIFTSSHSNLPIFVAPISLQFINHSKIFSQQILNYVRTHPTISASHS
ncbi:MAG: tetraacyldisaccharide 4'-kinase, partial [Bacteroidia bacterium]|nr:tetraacyldisaccharide 4'-kinase [Bacteroidia bacterium]